MEAGGVKAGEVLISGVADGSQYLQVVNRFQEIGFAVAVVADNGDAFRRQLKVDALEIAEVADGYALEPDLRFAAKRSGIGDAYRRDIRFAHLPLKLRTNRQLIPL